MSSAKWHPASGQLGILGDYGEGFEGSPEEREAYSAAQEGLTALGEYETKITGRQADIGQYYGEQRDLVGGQYDLKERGVGLAQEQIGVQREGVGMQESQALTSFLGDAYSFRNQADVGRATGGLAYSGGRETGIERRQATMSDMMRGRQDQFDMQRQGLDISSRGLDLQLEQLGISEAKELSDLARSQDIDYAQIEDLLYQLETEEMAYGGVPKP